MLEVRRRLLFVRRWVECHNATITRRTIWLVRVAILAPRLYKRSFLFAPSTIVVVRIVSFWEISQNFPHVEECVMHFNATLQQNTA